MDPKHLTLLRVHDACRGLSDAEVEAIGAEMEVVEMVAGELVHSVGQDFDTVYIVVAGRLKMTLKTPEGGQRTIRYISAGDQFGALMLVCDEELPVDVSVDQKAVLLRLRKEIVLQLVEQFPVFRRNLLRKIGHGVHESMDRRHKRTTAKIVAFIHADQQSKKLVAEIASNSSRSSANRLGFSVTPASVHRTILSIRSNRFRDQGGGYLDHSEVRSTIKQWPHVNRVFLVVRPIPSSGQTESNFRNVRFGVLPFRDR